MITVTQALATARKHVSMHRQGRQWVVVSPWNYSNLNGPTTSGNSEPWKQAQRSAACIKAAIALTLLGASDNVLMAAECDMYQDEYLRWEDVVRGMRARFGKGGN